MVALARAIADERGDDAAIIDETGTMTWAQFNERSNRALSALRERGHTAGGTVALIGGNRHEYLEASAALAHGGYIYPPINWHFTVDEVAYVLENSESTALIADAAFADLAMSAADKVDAVRDVIVFGDDVP